MGAWLAELGAAVLAWAIIYVAVCGAVLLAFAPRDLGLDVHVDRLGRRLRRRPRR